MRDRSLSHIHQQLMTEAPNHPREVVEATLAHVVQNKVEAAYARSDLFERRRQLMDECATYLELEPSKYPPAKPGALVCEPLKAA